MNPMKLNLEYSSRIRPDHAPGVKSVSGVTERQ
jgi:hypothetical protein